MYNYTYQKDRLERAQRRAKPTLSGMIFALIFRNCIYVFVFIIIAAFIGMLVKIESYNPDALDAEIEMEVQEAEFFINSNPLYYGITIKQGNVTHNGIMQYMAYNRRYNKKVNIAPGMAIHPLYIEL